MQVAWWERWKMLVLAEEARSAFRKPASAKLTKREQELKDWAMLKDRY